MTDCHSANNLPDSLSYDTRVVVVGVVDVHTYLSRQRSNLVEILLKSFRDPNNQRGVEEDLVHDDIPSCDWPEDGGGPPCLRGNSWRNPTFHEEETSSFIDPLSSIKWKFESFLLLPLRKIAGLSFRNERAARTRDSQGRLGDSPVVITSTTSLLLLFIASSSHWKMVMQVVKGD